MRDELRRLLPLVSLGLVGLLGALLLPSTAAAGPQSQVFATTTTYEIFGGTSRRAMSSPYAAVLDEYTIHSDAVVRFAGRWVFVVNRLYGDNILVLDAWNDFGVVTQYSVASSGLNPRDVALLPDGPTSLPRAANPRAFVPLYESNSLLACDALTGANRTLIDLSSFVVADALVEMDQVEIVGDRAFVTLQNQDRSTTLWSPTGFSRVAVIDVATETVVDVDPVAPGLQAIELALDNPTWRMTMDPTFDALLVLCAGEYGVLDGGIEVVDPYDLASDGVLVTEAQLGGDLLDFAIVDATTAWAIVSDPQFRTKLLRFDPSTGAVTATVHISTGFDLSDMELSLDGRLFVSDRAPSANGLRIYDASSGVMLSGPLNMGLPPYDLALVELTSATAAPELRVARRRLTAAPNPFNPRIVLELSRLREGATIPDLEVLDARGRRVTTIVGVRRDATARYEWDGTDATGRAVASGVYRARPRDGSAAALGLTLVR